MMSGAERFNEMAILVHLATAWSHIDQKGIFADTLEAETRSL